MKHLVLTESTAMSPVARTVTILLNVTLQSRCSSVLEHVQSMNEDLSSTPNIVQENGKKKQNKGTNIDTQHLGERRGQALWRAEER